RFICRSPRSNRSTSCRTRKAAAAAQSLRRMTSRQGRKPDVDCRRALLLQRGTNYPPMIFGFRQMQPSASIAALLTLLLFAGCAGSERKTPREPVKLDISIIASSGVNPDDQKRPAPIVVRIYELKNADALNQADFYSLQDKDKTVLNDDLIQRDQ